MKKQLVIGILAHVDAGKTTLSEGLLYLCGALRKMGRVDHGDAFLDTYALEKERGITIFSKQAVLETGDAVITLLDTPGHVDFSVEMERSLQVMDYAVLVISGADGVQAHTVTLWNLLERYHIPVFLFVNKMDQEGTDREALLAELKKRLSENCVDFDPSQDQGAFYENAAMCSEELLELFLEDGSLPPEKLREAIAKRRLFPCYFGSALRMTGVEEFLHGLIEWTEQPEYDKDAFAARVFKIARDDKGTRLTYLKVTGGSLKVRSLLEYEGRIPGQENAVLSEKTDQIRVYSGAKYETVQEAFPGMVCAVTGLSATWPGQGLGEEENAPVPVLEPVLNFSLILPSDCDPVRMLRNMRILEEEDPQLHIVWKEQTKEIQVMLMGEVQTEILRQVIWDRFHVAADFGAGRVVYRETIAEPVYGAGHYEPLRHYAEVHLLLEPGERGSGCQFFTACSEDVLARNWQRLILTHLEEKQHVGVLTGSPVTDLQITLITGRAHLKHTEGGDFRQATYRAVRQGLYKARNILLEPWYQFTLEVPSDCLGKAMTEIQKRKGTFDPPEQDMDTCILRGRGPVSKLRDYPVQLLSDTGGRGRIFLGLSGYEPCDEQEEAVREAGYDPDKDMENPGSSVFCAHGAGFLVPWYEADGMMHLHPELPETAQQQDYSEQIARQTPSRDTARDGYAADAELMAIFERTYGPVKSKLPQETKRVFSAPDKPYKPPKPRRKGDAYLLVDGYNIMFAWDSLKDLARTNITAAQERLKEMMSDYQGSTGGTLILVFDAYKLENHPEEVIQYHNIYVVYTRTAETADQYIERTVHSLPRGSDVTVATSDSVEQIIIMGQGARRLSASGFQEEVDRTRSEVRERILQNKVRFGTSLQEKLDQLK